MASGRVGGTRSKISGQVGKDIYEVRRNPDGTYTQIVYAKGEPTATTTTPRLQAQRMCTAMVETLMRDLKPVASVCMQSAANKSKSLNAFSSFNLRMLAQDCKNNWYQGNRYCYPSARIAMNRKWPAPGPYMLSAGTLQFDLFSEYGDYTLEWGQYEVSWGWKNMVFGLKWNLSEKIQNVGQFLKAYRMTRLDYIIYCAYIDRTYDIDPETGDGKEERKYIYMILQVNPRVPDSAPMTNDTIRELFLINGPELTFRGIKRDHSQFIVAFVYDNYDDICELWTQGAFSISYLDGKKKISNHTFDAWESKSQPWLNGFAPCHEFGSWMGEPSVDPYPSPFG